MASSDPFSFARDDFSAAICHALRSGDFASIESCRDGPVVDYVSDLVTAYGAVTDWESKDLIVHLIQDCADERTHALMEDALNSPTADTRAIAVCALQADFSLFDSFIVNGFVNADRVDQAVERYRSR